MGSEYTRKNSNQNVVKPGDFKLFNEEEQKMNKVQDNLTVVKNSNPGLFGAPQSKATENYNPFAPTNTPNNGVKTPQIFVENKAQNQGFAGNKPNNNLAPPVSNPVGNVNSGNEKTQGKIDKLIDNSTDKAFDALWENEKFQKGMKDGAKNAAYNAVAGRVPIKAQPGGKDPLGAMAEKLTEKALENDKVQQSLKDAAKNATKDAIKKEVNPAKAPEKKKAGLFGFI